ncbi:MAG: hypothetical protein OXG40_14960 [Acidimicrobiaceae bacterium]|nr:hypothetical protein [Acidimicrobiaceae bacterium]MDE0516025.1 hypothetical protein [Acidimicrobiaceae bacterium]
MSLVGTDGGNNQIRFDPFLVQVVRVVDSSNNEYCVEAVTPTTGVRGLSAAQFDDSGEPRTALGSMMQFLGVRDLTALSHMIHSNDEGRPISPSWVQVYRELMEWAVLFKILREKDFANDTIIVYDGLLRSKVFSGELFIRLSEGFAEQISRHRTSGRNIYLVGVAKHSKVLDRYRLAMALQGILRTNYPAYAEIPRDIEAKAYTWSEYARGSEVAEQGGEANKFVAGKMFFVKFGPQQDDPIWPVDLFEPQTAQAPEILGALLADATEGFPVPYYPLCLQKAHENAALVDFDFDVIQDLVFDGIRDKLGNEAPRMDEFQLQAADPSALRY